MTTALCILALALQQQPGAPVTDSIYETAALREFVGRAAAANALPPGGLENYYARIETELAFVRAEPDGREVVLQLEQVASDLYWRRDGGMLQELVGYRSQTLGASFSGLSFFDVPWAVPTLYGDRLDLLRTSEPVRGESGRVRNRRAVHPFASRRDAVYRFSGGDTVDVIRLPERTIPIVRIHVKPRAQPGLPTLLFEGDVDVDVTRLHIVRMQGRLIPSGRRETWGSRLIGAAFAGVLFVRFESGEYDEAYWLPREQRFEVQAISRLGEGRTVFRAISRFVDVWTNDERAARLAANPDSFPYGRIIEPDLGRISGFNDWRLSIGSLVGTATATDFDSYAPPRLVTPRDEARVAFGTRHFSQLLRFNRVEGVFTGAGIYAQFGRSAPGLVARLHGGYAWSEQTGRGGAELMQRTGPWEWGVRAERQLAHTNDFLTSLEPDPGVAPLLGGTEYDYVDRWIGGLVVRRFPVDSLGLRLEVARAGDRNVGRNLQQPGEIVDPEDADRPNRPVTEGDYWLTRGEMHWNPSAGALSLMPGAGVRIAYEGAYGDLDWQRLEGGLSMRYMPGRWTLAARLDGGVLLGPAPPPQALFELGSSFGLPGFTYKAFTGDRAALARTSVGFRLPLLNAPVRIGSLYLPAPAPTPAVGLQAGWTEASPETEALMDAWGWTTSDGVRATVDLRLRLFGGSVSVGAARPLERGADWKFVWGLVAGI
jgi:hypothetical protein